MDYEKLAESGFADLDREGLKSACRDLGVTFGPNSNETTLRQKLMAAMGRTLAEPVEPAPAPAAKKAGMPNLDPDGAWGGKWYFVKVGSSNPRLRSCPVGWNGNYRNLPLNEMVRVIAPHYRVLLESVGERITQESYRDQDNIQKFRPVSVPFSEFFVMEAREDPATAHLPEDYVGFFKSIEKRNPNFVGLARNQLAFIATKLDCEVMDGDVRRIIRQSDIKGMSDDDLRHLICLKLVPNYGLDIFDGVEAA